MKVTDQKQGKPSASSWPILCTNRKEEASFPCNFHGMAFIMRAKWTMEKNQMEKGICFLVR
jgi:hypothetical protein